MGNLVVQGTSKESGNLASMRIVLSSAKLRDGPILVNLGSRSRRERSGHEIHVSCHMTHLEDKGEVVSSHELSNEESEHELAKRDREERENETDDNERHFAHQVGDDKEERRIQHSDATVGTGDESISIHNSGFEGKESVEHGGIPMLVFVDWPPLLGRGNTSEVNISLTEIRISTTDIRVQVMSNGVLMQPCKVGCSNQKIKCHTNVSPQGRSVANSTVTGIVKYVHREKGLGYSVAKCEQDSKEYRRELNVMSEIVRDKKDEVDKGNTAIDGHGRLVINVLFLKVLSDSLSHLVV